VSYSLLRTYTLLPYSKVTVMQRDRYSVGPSVTCWSLVAAVVFSSGAPVGQMKSSVISVSTRTCSSLRSPMMSARTLLAYSMVGASDRLK
jgi:hypothetical protein